TDSVHSTTISNSSQPSSSAAHLLPWLMLWGRCLLACAAQLWLVAAAVQAGGQDEDNEDMCIQISSTLSKLFEVFQPSLQLVLANSSL
ncbi:hypothetical protein QSG17_24865, partial [Escherichia coli]|uniref:hypothetical protein n=1 Tax=Escherichia coli TaxID=562 RepID=UPI002738E165